MTRCCLELLLTCTECNYLAVQVVNLKIKESVKQLRILAVVAHLAAVSGNTHLLHHHQGRGELYQSMHEALLPNALFASCAPTAQPRHLPDC